MPITFVTFGIGYLAIIGVPPFGGFYSKDHIIEAAFGAGGARGLLLGGAVAPVTGSLIDRYGTRLVMTIGSGLAGLSLFALAEARGIVSYTLAMVALQAVTTAVFYDAAFAALTQARGSHARRAISQRTASTRAT